MGSGKGYVLTQVLFKTLAHFFFFFFPFLRPYLLHMEVPELGVELELQLLAYAPATAMWDPHRICDLPHSSGPDP